MSTDPFDRIIELAIAEPEFRKELLDDPVSALSKRDIELDPKQIAQLEAIAKEEIGVVSDELSDRLAKVSEVERSY